MIQTASSLTASSILTADFSIRAFRSDSQPRYLPVTNFEYLSSGVCEIIKIGLGPKWTITCHFFSPDDEGTI